MTEPGPETARESSTNSSPQQWKWSTYAWQAHIIGSTSEVSNDIKLACLSAASNGTLRPELEEAIVEIKAARQIALAERRGINRVHIIRWLKGGHIDLAYRHLHCAATIVARWLPIDEIHARTPDVLSKYRKCLDSDADLRLVRLERLLSQSYLTRERDVEHDGDKVMLEIGDLTAFVMKAPNELDRPGFEGGSQVEAAAAKDRGAFGVDPSSQATVFAAVLRSTYDILDQKHVALRNLRNGLISGTIILTAIVALFCFVAWMYPTAVPLCFDPPVTEDTSQVGIICPSRAGEDVEPSAGDVALVASVGLLGAALSSAIWVSRLPASQNSHTISFVLALFKLPVGALTALAGLLIIHGRFVPGLSWLDTQPQVLAYAFVFGFAQQVVTGVIDRQAGDILKRIPDKEAKAAKPSLSLSG